MAPRALSLTHTLRASLFYCRYLLAVQADPRVADSAIDIRFYTIEYNKISA
jgi:hypothetical protein